MYTVRGTKKLLDRVGRPMSEPLPSSTTVLGDWYANVLFWRPQVAMFVSASTFVPVLLPPLRPLVWSPDSRRRWVRCSLLSGLILVSSSRSRRR
ncbi:MAG: hypothetical protein KDB21_12680 [Acidimicrobiales bacterium]|nr:hypothetical protein [Acidimicrobiales bacterium]